METKLSPCGKYAVEIRTIGHHQTRIRLIEKDATPDPEIITIERNFTFDGGFFQKGGDMWFWTGRDYCGQMFVNLSTRKVFEYYGVITSFNFIWCDVHISQNGNVLAVEGCYWAGTYEIQFFDFTDPSHGWRQIEPSWGDLSESQIPSGAFCCDEYSEWRWVDDHFIYIENVIFDTVLQRNSADTDIIRSQDVGMWRSLDVNKLFDVEMEQFCISKQENQVRKMWYQLVVEQKRSETGCLSLDVRMGRMAPEYYVDKN